MRAKALVCLTIGVLLLAGACSSDDQADGEPSTEDGAATEIIGLVRDQPLEVGEVVLPEESVDGSSAPFEMVAPEGGLLLVYFGYTSCPDVCPTTLSDVKGALAEVDGADAVSLAMVTVDPDRDTAQVLDGYLDHFLDRYHVIRTTDPAALEAAEDAFGASSSVTKTEDGTVEVAHTGTLYAVDDTGTVVVEWPFGTPRDALASDLQILVDRTPTTTGDTDT